MMRKRSIEGFVGSVGGFCVISSMALLLGEMFLPDLRKALITRERTLRSVMIHWISSCWRAVSIDSIEERMLLSARFSSWALCSSSFQLTCCGFPAGGGVVPGC